MIRLSGSSLPRVDACPASAVLPHVEHESEDADAGSALHEHIKHRAEIGVDDAMALLDETMARWGVPEKEAGFLRGRLSKFEWSPPAGAICEIRLALMQDWTVQRVPAEQRFVEGAIFTGQFDVVWTEPRPLIVNEDGSVQCPAGSVLWVLDLKGGQDRYVETIERNLQVATYAFLAAKWTGAKRVAPAICYPGPGEGEWDVPGRMWSRAELDAVEGRLRRLLARTAAQESALVEGRPLELTEGRHCEFCPALTRCPAKTAMFKAVLIEGTVPFGPLPLTDGDATQLVSMLAVLETFIRRGRRVLEAQVEETGRPIPLGDGVVWGPETSERTEILVGPAQPVLAIELGEFADQAMKVDVSGASIERAVKAQLEAKGKSRGVSPMVRRIYAKLGEAGALVQKPRVEWKAHRPKLARAEPGHDDAEDLGEAI